MRRRTMLAVFLVALVAVAGAVMTPVSLVRATGEAGNHIVCARIGDDSPVALTFTHSMYGGDVTEFFEPGNRNALLRTLILTDNAAAAEYYAWDGAVRERGGRYEVVVPDEAFAELSIRVDAIGNHRLTIDDTTYHLASIVGGSSRVRLSIVTRPLFTQVFGARC